MNSRKSKANEVQKPSLLPPAVVALFSAVLPGSGHAFARAFRKGLLLLLSFITIVGLWVWRLKITARREEGWWNILKKSFQLHPILLILALVIVFIYILIIIDAYKTAQQTRKVRSGLLWFFILIAFFALGWQIGDIQPSKLFGEANNSAPLLFRILWPWERAVTYPEENLVGLAKIQIPCVEPIPEPLEVEEDEPYIQTNPTCGDLSKQDGTPGTVLHVIGYNFAPETETQILWRDDQGNEFRYREGGEYIKVITDANGEFEMDVTIPYRVIPPSTEREFAMWEIRGQQIASIGEPVASEELKLSIEKMIETIMLGMMSTFFGIILAIPVSFLAAKNLMSTNWLTLGIYYIVRGILNIIRSIEPLIWAVIAILTVGLGPFAGIIALTIHSVASLGKLYSEAIESIDPGPLEAIQATGANWLQTVIYGVIPQIIPPFVSFTIYRWDINVRMSTVIGMVGGGGIGFLLIQWIRLLDYKAAGIAVWFIAITVAILDYVSSEIRNRFI